MWYIYPQIILAIAIGIYLCCCFRRQPVKNWATLGLTIGFFSFALAGISHFLIYIDVTIFDINILYFGRYFLLILGLSLIVFGIMNLVTRSFILKNILPFFIFISGTAICYWGIYIEDNIPLITLIVSYVFFVPIDITLGILFVTLYSRLSFIKDGLRNNFGPLLIAIGWFIHGINMGRLYFILDKREMDIYMLFIVVPYIFWLIGFILLERESRKAFETKIQIHGLIKKEQDELIKKAERHSSERGDERKSGS